MENKCLKFIRNKDGESLKINKVTPELCYILGFAFGDGNFGSSARRSNFSISQSEFIWILLIELMIIL